MPYQHDPALTPLARQLRKNATAEENKLWYQYLRSFPIRFLRQKVIDRYIADFYCAKAKLVLELDGSQHYENDGITKDEIRTKALEKHGLLVIRIPNNEVRNNFPGVCAYIEKAVQERIGE